MKTGIQVSSFKPVLKTEEQVKTAFDKMKAMGCEWVQLQWIDPAVSVDFIAKCVEESGIRSVSVQDFYEIIRENKEYYISLNEKTGGKWMCISRIPERLKSKDGLSAYVEELEAFQKELDEYGQKLCLHPVSADFAPIDGMDPVAFILEKMPQLEICADLFHLNKCGYDMPAWLRKYAGRVCMAHFKDGKGDQLVPAGQGDTDWTGVVEACLETGVEYGFAEQERWEKDPFVSLEEALTWLNGKVAD